MSLFSFILVLDVLSRMVERVFQKGFETVSLSNSVARGGATY